MSLCGDHGGSEVSVLESYVGRHGNAYKNTGCTLDGGFEKRARNCSLCRDLSLVLTGCRACTHVSIACIAHYACDVREVKVDEAGNVDELGNTLNTAAENVVCDLESILESDAGLGDLLESFVGNDNEGVNVVAELLDTLFCLKHTAATLKEEGLGYDRNRENIHFVCDSCNNGSRAGTCSAAHTGCNEYHICACKSCADLLGILLCRALTDLGICACAVTLGDLLADGNECGRYRIAESLTVGVDRNKLNASDICVDHSVDRVVTAAANTDDLDADAAFKDIVVRVKILVFVIVCHFQFLRFYR